MSSGTLRFDEKEFRANFGKEPFLVKHSLVGHPLFELPKLIELAQSLPESSVEYNAGNVPVSIDPSQTPRTGLSIEETIRRIEECKSWMVLKNVERNPAYRELLDLCLNDVAELSEKMYPGMYMREAFIFVSSPGSITPFHLDPEYNFLLQIRGEKEMHVFDGSDRTIMPEDELERFYTGGFRNLVFKDDFEKKAKVFTLQPGDALHVPVAYPHWVKNGNAVSISFSITFLAGESYRRAALYRINHKLRKMGLRPSGVGNSSFSDGLKFTAFKTLRTIKSLVRRTPSEMSRKYGA